ncbi:hypothetical protein J6590_086336 [Homalodisca vitripennis]|nr:hypothetical protein J6590_086336 [Homalodisca vitripennis]
MAGQLRGRAGDDCVTSHIEQSLCTSRFVVVSQSGPRCPHAHLQPQSGLSNRSVGSAEAWWGYPDWRARIYYLLHQAEPVLPERVAQQQGQLLALQEAEAVGRLLLQETEAVGRLLLQEAEAVGRLLLQEAEAVGPQLLQEEGARGGATTAAGGGGPTTAAGGGGPTTAAGAEAEEVLQFLSKSISPLPLIKLANPQTRILKLQGFEHTLSEIIKKPRDFIIMGDFNIDVLDVNSPTTKRLADLLRTFGLEWSVNSQRE